jgi:ribonuclease HII
MLDFEEACWAEGHARVAGVDEAGRGPLAGPVVAAAVTMPRPLVQAELDGRFRGLTDSKKLTPARRESFFEVFQAVPGIEVGVGEADVAEIDGVNILRATHLAMSRAVRALGALPDHVLVDGRPVPGLPCPSTAIVGGDRRSLLVAAASVVAKVHRDRLMLEWDAQYPQYGFARHKGYGSRRHIQALFEYGPCPIHRRSFRPVREAARLRRAGSE